MNTYLLSGDEEYLKDAKVKDLKETYTEKPNQSLNFDVFYCGQADVETAIQTAKTSPFLNQKRITVLKNIQNLNDAEKNILFEYLKNPQQSTIFVMTADKEEAARAFMDKFPKVIRVLRFNKLNMLQLSNWIQKGFQARKKKIGKDIIDALIETAGNDLANLENCIEKIALYSGNRFSIQMQDLEATMGPTISGSVFTLIDAIIQKDPKKALMLARHLVKYGKKTQAVVNAIFRQFEKLFLAKQLILKDRLSRHATAARLGVNRYFAEKFFNQADSFTPQQLKNKFRIILWADLKSKTTGVDHDMILDLLVTRLCLGDELTDPLA